MVDSALLQAHAVWRMDSLDQHAMTTVASIADGRVAAESIHLSDLLGRRRRFSSQSELDVPAARQ